MWDAGEEKSMGADAVGDEVRRVFGQDDALAQDLFAEALDAVEDRGRGVMPATSSRSFM